MIEYTNAITDVIEELIETNSPALMRAERSMVFLGTTIIEPATTLG